MRPQNVIILSGLTSVLSLAVFFYIMLPFAAMVAFSVFVSSMGVLTLAIPEAVRDGYRNLVTGRGIGDSLPSWLYQLLAEETLHDWMRDPTFALEMRHLLLYMLPGISNERLEAYVDRLAPRHREALRRPGLGQFMGNEFMRIIMGDQRFQPDTNMVFARVVVEGALPAQQQSPLTLLGDSTSSTTTMQETETATTSRPDDIRASSFPPSPSPRRLLYGDSSDQSGESDAGLNASESSDVAAGGLNENQALRVASHSLSPPGSETPATNAVSEYRHQVEATSQPAVTTTRSQVSPSTTANTTPTASLAMSQNIDPSSDGRTISSEDLAAEEQVLYDAFLDSYSTRM